MVSERGLAQWETQRIVFSSNFVCKFSYYFQISLLDNPLIIL